MLINNAQERKEVKIAIMWSFFSCIHVFKLLFTYWTELKPHVTPNGDATAFVQRSKNLLARCGVAAKHA